MIPIKGNGTPDAIAEKIPSTKVAISRLVAPPATRRPQYVVTVVKSFMLSSFTQHNK
jgi:hypothetical protein